MLSCGALVRVHARPGKEHEVERLLRDAVRMVNEETWTETWFGLRIDCVTFGMFDAFDDPAARRANLSGAMVGRLLARSDELFVRPPTVEKVDVLAAKLPARIDRF
ncbi:hypothetical protein Sru01_15820 [Sphaerisporangium rufum]|uniref:Antibiotic biosynthesis monooxygenase n=1 Tax=Sphaerisporangium rufum TaxID=1381558 RepID=A0A919R1D0_9ACTN|nr:antibiotic biosynthesis monooxygenase [Sphaerisporangium rufum]GII76600.1 hypothetical protein Sru01_15820 [Sphaerisporangium rufum]